MLQGFAINSAAGDVTIPSSKQADEQTKYATKNPKKSNGSTIRFRFTSNAEHTYLNKVRK